MNSSKYNPPVKATSKETKSVITSDEFNDFLKQEFDLNEKQIASLKKHHGIFAGPHRYDFLSVIPEKTPVKIYLHQEEPADIPLTKKDIVYEDDYCLAVNKPAWFPTQATRASIITSLEYRIKKITGYGHLMAVHRLDRQTSGLVVFGKGRDATAKLMQAFAERHVEKTYLAIVSPPPATDKWEMKGYMARDFAKLPKDVFRFSSEEKKKSLYSETHFEVLKKDTDKALVLAKPHTGRTHQLRVHLSYSGCPIIGDTVYGSFKEAKKWGEPRIQLHAYELTIPRLIKNPKGKKSTVAFSHEKITFTTPMPTDFIEII